MDKVWNTVVNNHNRYYKSILREVVIVDKFIAWNNIVIVLIREENVIKIVSVLFALTKCNLTYFECIKPIGNIDL
jgi:hypothetical protein